MVYLACDIIDYKNKKIIKRYLYGMAIPQLAENYESMSLEDHKKYIKKKICKKIRSNKKILLHEIKFRIFTIKYKDLIKSGIEFETFHPPGFRVNTYNINPFPKGKILHN